MISDVELRKRKREKRVAFFIFLGFVALTVLQASITDRREGYGFVQSLLYFALLHLNVCLIMLLGFLVIRNLVKAYLLRRSGKLGSSLRWKMVTSLLAFTLLPSLILFSASSYIIRQGFDRWFGGQVASALEDAQSITKVHYDGIEGNLDFFSKKISAEVAMLHRKITQSDVDMIAKNYPLHSIELYSDLVNPPLRWVKAELASWNIPRAAVESLSRAFSGESFHLIRQYGDGDLVQSFESVRGDTPYILVLSQTVPLGLKTRISELEAAFSSYQKTRLLKDSIKTNYTLILLTLFMLIVFVVSWFGLYLARSVTEPVAELMKATEEIREGRWNYRIPTQVQSVEGSKSSAPDLEVLKAAFNLMAEEVGRRGQKLEEANAQLISLVDELEERERYLEILISSIRRGVVVLDPFQRVRRVNSEALVFASPDFQKKDLSSLVGMPWGELFASLANPEEIKAWLEESSVRKGQPVDKIFDLNPESAGVAALASVRATGIQLLDDRRLSLGWLIILEDVSDAARLERLAAWQEVARRVAHEIKNPLTPIQISADRLARRLSEKLSSETPEGQVFHECIGQIQKQVRVIRDLVKEFSQFAKLPEPKFQPLDLSRMISDLLADYRFNHPQCEFHFHNEFNGTPKLVKADPEYLRRLVVNLADNALQAMEDANVAKPRFSITLKSSDTSSHFIAVIFEDGGPGISESLREKIFDPYVTSKASGLGLGLPIVRRIAIEHSGRIRCEAASGGRFVLELPLITVDNQGVRA